MSYRVAVLGATGLVGRTLMSILDERSFPVDEMVPLASERSAGGTLPFRGEEVEIRLAEPDAFDGIDVVLSSAGGSVSKELLPEAAARGAVSIDNTSAYRMEEDVPLVVPECNPHRIADYTNRGIIANPNCSTIQLVMALKPLHEAFGLKTVRVATYQSVSGAGQSAVQELLDETRYLGDGGEPGGFEHREFPRQIAFNALPHIDVFLDGGDTKEEWKMRVETPKILEIPVELHATCVRIPVMGGHSEAAWIETERPVEPDEARRVLAAMDGLEVIDDPEALAYPTAVDAEGTDPVYVGRIRKDPTVANGLAFWCVADNLRKGAALNAVQIAEGLVRLWETEGRQEIAGRTATPA
ncbi:MAG: aspartate-semialdehyde dehydrogenase [Acidobacteriota bacterium]|jgi:aspartate-semialdehyde dehydrogenase